MTNDGVVVLSYALAIPIVARDSASCMVFYKFSHGTYIISYWAFLIWLLILRLAGNINTDTLLYMAYLKL